MITIAIPTGGKMPDMQAELASAKNIKDRQTRNNTISGLNKIANYL